MKVSYIINEKGARSAVVIPIKEWDNIERQLQKPKTKLRKRKSPLVREMEQAIEEVTLIKTGKKKPKSIEQLLHEL
ncbi:MAG: hypothetical protein JWO06_3060 [Bacteroidota bacterium]|nr:hypothetical protein [Bacteroidota bacterium]